MLGGALDEAYAAAEQRGLLGQKVGGLKHEPKKIMLKQES